MKRVFAVGLFVLLSSASFAQTAASPTYSKAGKTQLAQSYCGQCSNAQTSCTVQCNGSGVCIQRCNDEYEACLERNFCRGRR